MKEWKGIVEQISDKDWNNIKLWSFRLEGVDRWFRTQKTPLPAMIGDSITFEERNNQVDLTTVVVGTVSDAPPSTAPTESESTAPAASTSSAASVDVGARIQWQAARSDACNVMVACLNTDNMPWPANLAKGKRLDMLLGYINELTKQFLEEENG